MNNRKKLLLASILTVLIIGTGYVIASPDTQTPTKAVQSKVMSKPLTPKEQNDTQTAQPNSTETTQPTSTPTVIQSAPVQSQADQNKDQINALITARCQALGCNDNEIYLQVSALDKYISDQVGWNDYDGILNYWLLDMFLHPKTDADGTVHSVSFDNGHIYYQNTPPAN